LKKTKITQGTKAHRECAEEPAQKQN